MTRRIWSLVSAELKYSYPFTTAIYSLLFLFAMLIGVPSYESNVYFMLPPTSAGFTFMLWMVIIGHTFLTYRMITGERIEQRIRFLLPLPVTRNEIGLARIVTVFLLHLITLVLLVFWVITMFELRDFSFPRSLLERTSTFGLYMIIIQGAVSAIAVSLCISFLIMLLESRLKPPLLSSIEWIIFAALVIILLVFSISLPFRWTGLAFIPRRRSIPLPAVTPYFALVALFLGYWYKVRIQKQDSYKG